MEPRTTFSKIFDAVKDVVLENFSDYTTPDGTRVRVRDIAHKDLPSLTPDVLSEYRDKAETLAVPITAKVEIRRPDGEKMERRIKLFSLPVPTPFDTFIIEGIEYNVLNQWRLRPGIYTRIKDNGMPEGHMNTTLGWQIKLDITKDDIVLRVGTRKFSVYPILKALGATDQELIDAFGEEVFSGISAHASEKVPASFADLISRGKRDDFLDVAKDLKFDPKINKITVGQEISNFSKEALIAAIKKLLAVAKGQVPPDNRDSILFKEFRTAEDFFKERLEDLIPQIKYKLNRLVVEKNLEPSNLGTRLWKDPFGPQMTTLGLVSYNKQTNPIRVVNNASRSTLLGEGGIKSSYAISLEARSIDATHFGVNDAIQLPQTEHIGSTYFRTINTIKDKNELKTALLTPRGETVYLSPREMVDKAIAFPDEIEIKNGKIVFKNPKSVAVIVNQRVDHVPQEQVDYILKGSRSMFSVATAMLPFLKHTHPARASMAAVMTEQAVPLVNPDVPLLKTVDKISGKPMDEDVAKKFNIYSPVDATVTHVDDLAVTIDKPPYRIPLWYYYPLNEGVLTSRPVVKADDKVKKGQLLAESNFTKGNNLALGKNMFVAFLPYKGLNFEDAVVVSESAAKKLTSMHLEEIRVKKHGMVFSKKDYIALYSGKFTPEQLNKLDSSGIAELGAILHEGDPVVVALKEHTPTPYEAELSSISRKLYRKYDPFEITWHFSFPGRVDRVVDTPDLVTIYIYYEAPAQVGDKLTNRYGNKGVISKIIPDSEMPRTKDGKIVDALYNPLGVISRINIGQLYELAYDKDTEKDPLELADKKPKTHTLVDPVTGKEIKNVLAGNQYVHKLEHVVLEKSSARYIDSYDADLTPVKGGDEGAKRLDALTLYSALAFANPPKHLLNEVATLKAEQNYDAWHVFESGGKLPAPKPTFAFTKFVEMLKAAGVNVEQKGAFFKPFPVLDRWTAQVSNGEIKTPKLLVAGKLVEEEGGLFDRGVTGGLQGKMWGHYNLAEPVLNPIFVPAVASIVGVGNAELEKILKGQSTFNDKTGPDAILSYLKKINIDDEIRKAHEEAKLNPKDLDKYNRKIRFLMNLKKFNIRPEELFITKLPILPPVFRPVFPKAEINLISPLNEIYRDIGLINDGLKELKELPFEAKKEVYANLYDHIKSFIGLTDPSSPVYTGDRAPQGILELIAGPIPKAGYFQSKLLSRKQDLVGRSTIIPNDTLSIDEIGIPENIAWQIFAPFVLREMRLSGISPVEAAEALDKRDERARRFLRMVMDKRLVLANRAPSLHKFNIMAYKPKLVAGNALQVNPLTVASYAGDFDGDTMTIHTPVSDEALKDAYEMLPSRNYLNPRNSAFMFMPAMEAIQGLYNITVPGKKTNLKFESLKDLEKAIYENKLEPTDEVTLNLKSKYIKTSFGRALILNLIPEEFHNKIEFPISKSGLQKLLIAIFKKNAQVGDTIVNELNRIGNNWAYLTGFTIHPEDLRIREDLKREIPATIPDDPSKVVQKINKALLEKAKDNNFTKMVLSGARGNVDQLRQILVAPVFAHDVHNNPFPKPIKRSYTEGLKGWEYWLATIPARKGLIDKKVSIKDPGEMTKEFVALLNDFAVTEEDCGTRNGKELSLREAQDFALATDVVVDNRVIAKRNTWLTPEVAANLERAGVERVVVRTPLTCEARSGVCVMCAGLDEYGKPHQIGHYIGITSAQALTEPATQLALKSAHIGLGLNVGAFEKFKYIVGMPKTSILYTPMAESDGTVEKIFKDEKGWHVIISGKEYISRKSPREDIKQGVVVKKGDPVFVGLPHVRDVYEQRGLHGARDYIYSSIKNIYDEQGIRAHPKHFMLVTRALTNYGIVTDPKNSPYVPGDRIKLSFLAKHDVVVPTEHAEGHALAENLEHIDPRYKIGYVLKENDVIKIADYGLPAVRVKAEKPEVEPAINGVEQVALLKTDLLDRLAFRNIKGTIQEAAIRGWASNLHGYSPIPAFIAGKMHELKMPGEKK